MIESSSQLPDQSAMVPIHEPDSLDHSNDSQSLLCKRRRQDSSGESQDNTFHESPAEDNDENSDLKKMKR